MIRVSVIALSLFMAGCGFFRRTPNQFYSLEPIRTGTAVANVRGTPVAISGVELPPGLDRRGIVVRGADHKVEVRGTHQWTAPLEEMVVHTLAFDLAHRLPVGMVILPGQDQPPGARRSISVVLEELAPGPDPVFVLEGRWIVREPGRGETAHHERIEQPMASMESAAIADAMSRALATLADRMAAGLGGT